MAALQCRIWSVAAANSAPTVDAGYRVDSCCCGRSQVKARRGNSVCNAATVHLLGSAAYPKSKRMNSSFVCAASAVEVERRPDELVATLLSLVEGTDRGVKLSKEEQAKVNEVATALEQFCPPEPLKDPRIFGEWDVVYCSNPTAPGGYYRSMVGRALLRTDEMVQTLAAPDVVGNKVVFSLFGLLGGEVSLKGKLTVQDEKWIQIVFDSPSLKLWPADFQYGGQSTVRIAVTYVDETIRLGRGSRGSLFVFRRKT